MKKYTSLYTVISKLQRDYGINNIDEATLIEWSAEALSAINAVPDKMQVVKFFYVKDYQVELPSTAISLNQIIILNKNKAEICNCLTDLCKKNPNSVISQQRGKVDCNDTRECFNLTFRVEDVSSIISDSYIPVRLATGTFSSMYNCSDSTKNTCYPEYILYMNEVLRFNFTDKTIAVSYNIIPIDEEGMPLIPDNFSHITAIAKYILYKYIERQYYLDNTVPLNKYQMAKSEWEHYVSQAATESLLPKSIDELQNITEMWLSPFRGNHYYDLFSQHNRRKKYFGK